MLAPEEMLARCVQQWVRQALAAEERLLWKCLADTQDRTYISSSLAAPAGLL